MGDDPKRLILARRAKFVAAALAGASVAANACSSSKVCLSMITNPPDASPPPSPQPCLTAPNPNPPPDAGDDASDDASTDAPDDAPDGD